MKPGQSARLVNASLSLPMVLGPGISYRLPLQVPDRIGSAAGEWHDVILPKTGTGTACFAGRWAGMLSLEPALPHGIDARLPKAVFSRNAGNAQNKLMRQRLPIRRSLTLAACDCGRPCRRFVRDPMTAVPKLTVRRRLQPSAHVPPSSDPALYAGTRTLSHH
jgi:hypothetical protein